MADYTDWKAVEEREKREAKRQADIEQATEFLQDHPEVVARIVADLIYDQRSLTAAWRLQRIIERAMREARL